MHSMAEHSLRHEPVACEQGTWVCSTCVHHWCVPAACVADQIDGRLKSMVCDVHPMAVLVNLGRENTSAARSRWSDAVDCYTAEEGSPAVGGQQLSAIVDPQATTLTKSRT